MYQRYDTTISDMRGLNRYLGCENRMADKLVPKTAKIDCYLSVELLDKIR